MNGPRVPEADASGTLGCFALWRGCARSFRRCRRRPLASICSGGSWRLPRFACGRASFANRLLFRLVRATGPGKALAAKRAHVPYRESVLTQLLQNALRGECKMLMFVNVSPEPANLSQSLSSLKFASTANKCVTGVVQRHAQKGVVAPPSAPAPTTVPSSKQR